MRRSLGGRENRSAACRIVVSSPIRSLVSTFQKTLIELCRTLLQKESPLLGV
jgi:hypothetical protein